MLNLCANHVKIMVDSLPQPLRCLQLLRVAFESVAKRVANLKSGSYDKGVSPA